MSVSKKHIDSNRANAKKCPVPAHLGSRSAVADNLPDSDEKSTIVGPPENEQTNPFCLDQEDINSLPGK